MKIFAYISGNLAAETMGLILGSDFWNDQLAFRDILRSKPEVAEEYAILKKQLAEKFKDDRDGYTEAKTAFIRSVLGQY